MDFSSNAYTIHPSGSTFNFFSRLHINYVKNYVSEVRCIDDLKNLNDYLYDEIMTTYSDHILRRSENLPMISRHSSGDFSSQNATLVTMNWNHPHSGEEENRLGNNELKKIFSFGNDFFTLTRKEGLCKDDLCTFESTHPQLQNWNLFGSLFLGHPFFSSKLSGSSNTTPEQVLSALYLAQLVLLRYRRTVSSILFIRKAMMCRIGGIVYRRFAVGEICNWRIRKEIESLSNGWSEILPVHWWRKMEKSVHSLNDFSPLEEGYQEEVDSFLEPPFPDVDSDSEFYDSYTDSSTSDMEDSSVVNMEDSSIDMEDID